jgi:glycosyltransferase involved in cell wall biosynthesis
VTTAAVASRRRPSVAIDLTPFLPGGENGGAAVLARALIRNFGELAPDTQFTLLTSDPGHQELADLEAPNTRRLCVEQEVRPAGRDRSLIATTRLAARALIDTVVPAPARAGVKGRVWMLVKGSRRKAVTRRLRPDLVFTPFTAPRYADPDTPLVAVIHDLQHLDHPEFFSAEVRQARDRHFLDACRLATRLICVSDFVRQTVLATGRVAPDRVRTIHSALLRPVEPDPAAADLAGQVLVRAGLGGRRVLLYPANAWPHKNHHRLLAAFNSYLQAAPGSDLALVCTGAPGPAMAGVEARARALLPAGRFAYLGYLTDRELLGLLQASRALVFPSLYEGFGLPVLEAMAVGRPVLCSDTASLPEIAGDAALLFDPHDPTQIAAAIARLETEPGLEASLVARGRDRAAAFGTARDMAARYLALFDEVRDEVSAR